MPKLSLLLAGKITPGAIVAKGSNLIYTFSVFLKSSLWKPQLTKPVWLQKSISVGLASDRHVLWKIVTWTIIGINGKKPELMNIQYTERN